MVYIKLLTIYENSYTIITQLLYFRNLGGGLQWKELINRAKENTQEFVASELEWKLLVVVTYWLADVPREEKYYLH